MANTGVWLSNDNVYGGFSPVGKEKSYHLRRLLVTENSNSQLTKYENDNFEFFDTELTELSVDIEYKKVNSDEVKLIPNTGQLLYMTKITILGNYGNDD